MSIGNLLEAPLAKTQRSLRPPPVVAYSVLASQVSFPFFRSLWLSLVTLTKHSALATCCHSYGLPQQKAAPKLKGGVVLLLPMKCLACTSQKLSAHIHCQDSKRLVHASRSRTCSSVRGNSVALAGRGRHPSQVPTTSCRNRGQTKRDEESQRVARTGSTWTTQGADTCALVLRWLLPLASQLCVHRRLCIWCTVQVFFFTAEIIRNAGLLAGFTPGFHGRLLCLPPRQINKALEQTKKSSHSDAIKHCEAALKQAGERTGERIGDCASPHAYSCAFGYVTAGTLVRLQETAERCC